MKEKEDKLAFGCSSSCDDVIGLFLQVILNGRQSIKTPPIFPSLKVITIPSKMTWIAAGLPLARSNKIEKAKFGHKKFKKGQIFKNEKSQIKAEFSLINFKMTRFKNLIQYCKFWSDFSKTGFKI